MRNEEEYDPGDLGMVSNGAPPVYVTTG
jgi:hypothetical protein